MLRHLDAVSELLSHLAHSLTGLLVSALVLLHSIRLFKVLWSEIPSWLKNVLIKTASKFYPLWFAFFVGFIVGTFGRWFL